MQAREGGTPEEEVPKGTQIHSGKGVLFCPHHPRRLLRGSTPRQRRPAAATNGDFLTRNRDEKYTGPCTAATNRSVSPGPTCNSQPLDNMLRVVTVIQQIMTEVSGAMSQEEKIVTITKIVLNLVNQNGH
jgi:hypothetical protein